MLDKFLPPTDNLYKFVSISGLLLIVLSFYPSYLNFKLGEQRLEHLKNYRMFMVDVDNFTKDLTNINQTSEDAKEGLKNLESKLNEHEQLLSKAEQAIKNKDLPEAEKLSSQITENRKEAEKMFLELKPLAAKLLASEDVAKLYERKNQQDIRQAELDSATELIKFYESEISYLQNLSRLLFILGLILTAIGFYFWYERIQKHNDLILVNQAQENANAKTEIPKQNNQLENTTDKSKKDK